MSAKQTPHDLITSLKRQLSRGKERYEICDDLRSEHAARRQVLEAKLSKAIELLKESRDVYVLGHELPMQWGAVEKIDAFLREAGHE